MSLPGVQEVFGYDFMQRALIAGLLISVVATILGLFAVLRGMTLISDGLAHLSFGGIALGLVLNVFPLETALLFAVLGAVGIQLVRTKGWVKSDVAIGLFFAAGLAFGVALVSRANINPTVFLFGSILTVTPQDLRWVASLSLLLGLLLAVFYKELVYVAFDEEAARVSGLPVGAINFGASILTGVGVVIAARIVGVLLVSALMIVPAAASLQVAKSFRGALAAAVVLGMASVAAGLYASYAYNVAPGAAIALVSLAGFVLCAAKHKILPGAS